MFHLYNGHHFLGMQLLWWLFWVAFPFIGFGMFEPVSRRKVNADNKR